LRVCARLSPNAIILTHGRAIESLASMEESESVSQGAPKAARVCKVCEWIARPVTRLQQAVLAAVDWCIARPSMFWLNRRLLVLAERGLGYHHCCDPARSGELDLIRRIARTNPSWCIDVGANVGDYSAALLSSSGASVIAFEPLPAAYKRLGGLRERYANRFFAFDVGLGQNAGVLELRYPSDESVLASFSSAIKDVPYVKTQRLLTHRVQVVTLDEFLLGPEAKLAVSQIDLLKIDVEGFEYEVLQGARRTIAEIKPHVIQIEFNLHQLFTGHTLLHFAKLLPDYTVWQLLPHGSCLRRVDPCMNSSNIFAYANFAFIRSDLERQIVDA
jgi:FkbM family methyltransferase